MPPAALFDEALAQRLPLPLAQLYRRSHNAKTALERHLTAFSFWEAGLKLVASVAVIEYAQGGRADPQLTEVLQSLARPSLGHWWEFARRLLPVLADGGDPAFRSLREALLGRTRDDLPRAAGLDAALLEALQQGQGGARSAVRLTELFDRLVRYRNTILLGHAAPGQLRESFHERMAAALLAGTAELWGRLDVLAGRRLLYVGEVRLAGGLWLVQRFTLMGEGPQRLPTLELPRSEQDRLPDGERVYLDGPGGEAPPRPLHPLLLYDAEAEEVSFLNARRGRGRTEYLCYTSGRTAERPDLGGEQRELLARALGMAVSAEQATAWADRSQADDPAGAGEQPPEGRRTLGEFELLSELGRGGMGVVYRAWQPSLGRQVALKKLLQGGDVRTEARFRREIRALGHVEHPHLVKIFTSGSEGDDWFYAMELVEGAPLSAVCDRLQASGSRAGALDLATWQQAVSTVCQEARRTEKPLSGPAGPRPETAAPAPATDDHAAGPRPAPGRDYKRQVVGLVRQAAEAAHALHEKGVIHRDVKPGNIMVTADGDSAVLMDLGLAQLADDEEGRLTRTRQFVGTLRYASPQQLMAVGRLDARSDVYSLGATLWELLALRPIYGATEQTPTPELMEKIQREEPERLGKYHPGVGRDLEAIVFKCLEKDPRRRYQSAAELARDLGRYLDGEPVRARPVRGLERGWKWARRRPAVAALSALAIALAVVGFGLVTWQWREAVAAWGVAEERRIEAVEAGARESARAQTEEQARKEAIEQTRQKEAALTSLWRSLYQYRIVSAQNEWLDNDAVQAVRQLDECVPGLRDWEWYYLRRLIRGGRPLLGHTSGVDAVAFSPDDKRVASGSLDATVRLWDAGSGEELQTLRGHDQLKRVTGVAFSGDGRRLVSSSGDGTVRLWDAEGGKPLHVLRGHGGKVRAVAFSPDGKQVASAGEDGLVILWDAEEGRRLGELMGHEKAVNAVAFASDGARLVTGGSDKTVRVWDLKTRQELLPALRGHSSSVEGVAFSPDGKQVASASLDRTVRVWDAATGRDLHTLGGHAGPVFGVAYSGDGRRLASAGEDRTVKVWDAASGRVQATFVGHRDQVSGVAFSRDGNTIASAGWDKTVRLWDAHRDQFSLVLRGADGATRVVLSPDGSSLALACKDGTVKLWDAATGREVRVLGGHPGEVRCVAFSPDGKWLASGAEGPWDETKQAHTGGELKVWDAASGRELRSWPANGGGPHALAISPDGKALASAGEDGTIKLWDAATGAELGTLTGHSWIVWGLAFNRDGTRLASAGADRTVRLWDVAAGTAVGVLRGHNDVVESVAFSPDGKHLASAARDRTVNVWDWQAGRPVLTLPEHAGQVTSVVYHPDGGRLVSTSGDGTVKVWDALSGQKLCTLRGHTSWVFGAAFSRDGRLLVTSSMDGTVRVWEAPPGGEEPLELHGPGVAAGVAFTPDGRSLVTCGGSLLHPDTENRARVWDLTTARERAAFDDCGVAVAVLAGGDRVATPGPQNTIKVLGVPSGKVLLTLRGHKGVVTGLAVHAATGRLASASEDQTVKVWDATTGKEVSTYRHTHPVTCVALSPDGERVVSGGGGFFHEGEVRVSDAATGRELLLIEGHAAQVLCVAVSPDGRWIASGGRDGTVKLWDAATGEEVCTLRGHSELVCGLAFRPDGKWLASSGTDQTVRLWEVGSGRAVHTLRGHGDGVYGVAFSPDGQRLASASTDDTARVWDLRAVGAGRGGAAVRLLLDWHRREAEECEKAKKWRAAVFHLDHLIEAEPSDAALYLRRGDAQHRHRDWEKAAADYSKAIELKASPEEAYDGRGQTYAESGRWDKAVADLAAAKALKPDEVGRWFSLGLAQLGNDDREGFRRTCAAMVKHFGEAPPPETADGVSYLMVLVPDAGADESVVMRLTKRAVDAEPDNGGFRETLGAACYRAGEFESAKKHLTRGVELVGQEGSVWMRLFLAMTHHRLGNKEEAAQWLDRAVKEIERATDAGEKDRAKAPSWYDRLRWRLLRREAETLLSGGDHPPP